MTVNIFMIMEVKLFRNVINPKSLFLFSRTLPSERLIIPASLNPTKRITTAASKLTPIERIKSMISDCVYPNNNSTSFCIFILFNSIQRYLFNEEGKAKCDLY